MSFNPTSLSVLAYANNFTLWHYTTKDEDVTSSGYFDKAIDMLCPNDLIIANVDTEGTPATIFYVVAPTDGSSISVAAYSS